MKSARYVATLAGCALLLAAVAVHAQMDAMDEGMDMGRMQGGAPPANARDPHAYSDGVAFTRGEARPRLADRRFFGQLLVDNLELLRVDGDAMLPYDVEGWYGGNYERAVLKAEGEIVDGDLAESRTEILWGHAVSAYWDTQLGIRHDGGEGPARNWLAAGVEGLAPYWFDVALTAYVGESSRTAFRLDASYDMLITQRLILQPRLEANLYGKDDPARGLGSGLADTTLAVRLRHEFRREVAPYIGVERVDLHGDTRALSRLAGRDTRDTRLLIGIRLWF